MFQDPADVATLVELKVLSDLFIPPVPIKRDKGNTHASKSCRVFENALSLAASSVL